MVWYREKKKVPQTSFLTGGMYSLQQHTAVKSVLPRDVKKIVAYDLVRPHLGTLQST